MPRYYSRPPRRGGDNLLFNLILLIMILGGVGALLEVLLPLLIVGSIGFGLYKLVAHQKQIEAGKAQVRLEDLKAKIRRTDQGLRLLDDYLTQENYDGYTSLSRQLLPQLESVQKEADQLKSQIPADVFGRISQKVTSAVNDISQQLNLLGQREQATATSDEERRVSQLAPEILSTYRQIRTDDAVIREKIKTVPNPAEQTALQDGRMSRFEEILAGYLLIKETPKNYYNAQERLDMAKTALEKIDLELDETLRQLNEDAMHDFDVNLRLMKEGKEHVEN